MANRTGVSRRRRRASFTLRYALTLLVVGVATAAAAGAVAWFATAGASTRQLVSQASGMALLGGRLLQLDSSGASTSYACQLAAAPPLVQAAAQPGSHLSDLVQAYAKAAAGDTVMVFSPAGALLAQYPDNFSAAQLGSLDLPSSSCARRSGGSFWAPGAARIVGLGRAPIRAGGRLVATVVVATPVTSSTLQFAQQLVRASQPSALLVLEQGGRALLGARGRGLSVPSGKRLPTALAGLLGWREERGLVELSGTQYAAAAVALPGVGGAAVAQLLTVVPTTPIGPTAAQLAAPLALAVAAVLLLGMIVALLVAERYLNRPLRRLNQAVGELGNNAYAKPIEVSGADEVARLAANFELMRRQLHRQLLTATGRSVIAATLSSRVPLEQALGQVLNSLQELLAVQMAMILVRPQATQGPGYLLTTGVPGPALEWAELDSGDGLLSRLLREPRYVARSLVAPSERGALEERIGLRDCLSVPLRSEGRELGILIVANKHAPYVEEDHAVCEGVATQVVAAVERSVRLAVTQREATTDAMTGLYNYRFLIGYLDQQVNVADRAGSSLSVLMLDLDHFKRVNDTHGHQAGDQVLRAFASIMVETIRKSDLAARYGGEEFVVVMANTGREEAQLVAEKIRTAVAHTPVQLDSGERLSITVSLGGVTFPEGTRGARNLLDLADRALYAAKRGGRDRVEFLDVAAAESPSRS
ncbi:MAG: sensor domain-containing diguanylate cyclase [Candidatus Dormibacteraeota bacterium]|nr:sensor domain-containing diguanylate cyclase [Candidatus Dormibacteraeota bacterium]